MLLLSSERLASAAFAFRGYNTTNLGRTPELLDHPACGPLLRRRLEEASSLCSDLLGAHVDLVHRVEQRVESSLETFGEDIGFILAVELAHIDMLRELHGVNYASARVAMGYSLGEITALVCGGVYELQDVLPPLVSLAHDCVELAHDTTMGIVFSRGPALSYEGIERLCMQITAEGQGTIDISSHLAPNAILVLGQGKTIDRLQQRLKDEFGGAVHLRKNQDRWPPLHTSLLWQRNVSNRAATMMQTLPRGFTAPHPPVISLVTGKASYNDYNSRVILNRWIDHPQRLWDGLCEMLAAGVDLILHVGPEPNLLPATFRRLSDNISLQLARWSVGGLGMRAMSGLARRPWLTKVLSSRTHLLRIPFVSHVIVEDWLLEQQPE